MGGGGSGLGKDVSLGTGFVASKVYTILRISVSLPPSPTLSPYLCLVLVDEMRALGYYSSPMSVCLHAVIPPTMMVVDSSSETVSPYNLFLL